MEARILHQSKLVPALLVLAAAVVAALAVAALTAESRSGTNAQSPPGVPAASHVAPQPSVAATAAPTPSTRKTQPMTAKKKRKSTRSVIVQSGRSVKGRSVTAKGAPGESAKAGAGGTSAQGGAGASASAKGGSANSNSVKIQTTTP
ncbi:MAG TPA: hypothetical protein VGV90_15710 [Solirubrobacteraceae bacterium]|nr:hypothetical protein [Solirubrobacteraceae bacterium]